MLLSALFIGLNSCGHVTVYNAEVCGDLGQYGAHCAETLTNKTRDISKLEWDEVRVGYLCMDSTAFNDTESAIDQLCQVTKICDYKTRKALAKAFARIEKVRSLAEKARDHHRKKLGAQDGI